VAVPLSVIVSLTTSLIAPTPAPAPATLTVVATGAPNEITLSWAGVTDATAYRVYQTTDTTFAQAGNSDPSQFSAYSPAATRLWQQQLMLLELDLDLEL
jgi:hypothetical protein